jgi:hypothetical protein
MGEVGPTCARRTGEEERPMNKVQERQLAKAIDRLKDLADDDRLCRCDQCKAIRGVLKAWKVVDPSTSTKEK